MIQTLGSRELGQLPKWDATQNKLRCLSVTVETDDVRTFVFAPDTPSYFEYRAGQFITLVLPTRDGPLLRTYTLSSSPTRPFSIGVTAKAQSGSIGTRWMFDHVLPGSLLNAIGPRGNFVSDDACRASRLFISAGSGITPFISMIRRFSDIRPDADIHLLACARNNKDLLFAAELNVLAHTMPHLRTKHFVAQEKADGLAGRIDATKLMVTFPDLITREIYCCGPERFMADVRASLDQLGFDMRHYHEESFRPDAIPDAVSPANGQQVEVVFTLSSMRISGAAGRTVLELAREAGVHIDTSCGSGLCGTCLVRKQAGEIEMKHRGGITNEEIAEGYILACCAHVLGNVDVEA